MSRRAAGWSLIQITRCAQNRLPRQQPAPAPNSETTAIALRSPYCLANFHGRPNAHPGRTPSPTPDPLAPSSRKKRHPRAPSVPRPCPIQSHARPTSSPRLYHFSPPIRPNPAISPALLKGTHIRATLAHARDRPRGPESLHPSGVSPRHP